MEEYKDNEKVAKAVGDSVMTDAASVVALIAEEGSVAQAATTGKKRKVGTLERLNAPSKPQKAKMTFLPAWPK